MASLICGFMMVFGVISIYVIVLIVKYFIQKSFEDSYSITIDNSINQIKTLFPNYYYSIIKKRGYIFTVHNLEVGEKLYKESFYLTKYSPLSIDSEGCWDDCKEETTSITTHYYYYSEFGRINNKLHLQSSDKFFRDIYGNKFKYILKICEVVNFSVDSKYNVNCSSSSSRELREWQFYLGYKYIEILLPS